MKKRILKARKSNKNLWETYLSETGPLNLSLPIPDSLVDLMDPYELIAEMYKDEQDLLPENILLIGKNHYENVFSKYKMEELISGVKINSLLDIINTKFQETDEAFKIAIENIAHDIVSKIEHESFYDNYSPGKLKEFIEDKLLSLKDNFRIESK